MKIKGTIVKNKMPRFYENSVLADIFSFFRWDKKQWAICDIKIHTWLRGLGE